MSKPLTCASCFLHDKGCKGVEICEFFAPKDGRTIPGGYYDSNQKAKSDAGKPRLTLVPRKIIFAIAKIREYGNKKYPEGGPDNYKSVEVDRYKDAMCRHAAAYLDDPHGVDEESGLPHLWHLACNVAFLCELEDEKIKKGMEDACRN